MMVVHYALLNDLLFRSMAVAQRDGLASYTATEGMQNAGVFFLI
jgi:hypothetical protein